MLLGHKLKDGHELSQQTANFFITLQGKHNNEKKLKISRTG